MIRVQEIHLLSGKELDENVDIPVKVWYKTL